jgi:energy-converting hydrogenase Eha subunit C
VLTVGFVAVVVEVAAVEVAAAGSTATAFATAAGVLQNSTTVKHMKTV